MNFFNNDIANFIQHIAIVFETFALIMVVYDLKAHHKDIYQSGATRLATLGVISGIQNRSRWFYFGIALAVAAIFMEAYQLGCLYFA